MVPGSIPFVHMFDFITRELSALKTILYYIFFQCVTIFYFTSCDSHRFALMKEPTPRTFIFIPQICHANITIHSTRCYKYILHY